MRPSDELLGGIEELTGSRPVSWELRTGGYSIAERFSLTLDDGRRVFAKRATTDDIARRVRDEHRNMVLIDERFRPAVLAYAEGDRPLLVLEDLSHAHWPPPWQGDQVELVIATIDALAGSPAPDTLASAEVYREMFQGWQRVLADPSPFLSLGIASEVWLDRCLPALLDAERSLVLEGDAVCHVDVRSDNLCIDGDRVVLVDWNWTCRGAAGLDVAFWAPSLRLEGGPLPDEIVTDGACAAAAIAGVFASHAGLPPPEGAPTVRRFQLRQLRIALPWVCRELGLPEPDVAYARAQVAALHADLEAGRIDEPAWTAGIEEVLIDAYLAADDPRAGSGKSGDETDWRWARELVLDVCPPGATFLDVGCANGYLMESLHRWGAERRLDIEPYGLDVSWRIASLARRRLPHWADRIWTGNVLDWEPPRRFDVVQIGLDESPRQRDVVERALSELVEPGGVLVLRAWRVGGKEPDGVEMLRTLGFEPDGAIEREHPTTGELRRTAWLRAK